MKKTLAVAVLIAGLTGAVQAAAISWGVGTLQIKDWNGVVQRGTTVELIFVGNTGGTAGEWVYETRTSTTQTTAAGGRAAVMPISPVINIGQQVAGSGQNLTTGQSQFIVRIFNMANTHWIDSGVFTFNAAADADNVVWAAGSVSTAGAVNLNIQNSFSNVENWEAIPEPTSLALIGLGVAALALRRRFSKKA